MIHINLTEAVGLVPISANLWIVILVKCYPYERIYDGPVRKIIRLQLK